MPDSAPCERSPAETAKLPSPASPRNPTLDPLPSSFVDVEAEAAGGGEGEEGRGPRDGAGRWDGGVGGDGRCTGGGDACDDV